MRAIFTDGINSLAHFGFGALAVYIWWVLPLFIVYQLSEEEQTNTMIDIGEFIVGYIAARLLKR